MVRGLYTAATGMNVERNKMNVVTNNIVNAETSGFKSDSLVTSTFDQVLLQRINDPNISIFGASSVGGYDYGTHVDELFTDYTEGTLEETDKKTDLALVGNGLFTLQSATGQTSYTRSGNFTVNSEGYLVTQDGDYVMGKQGRIKVGSEDFSVTADGQVTGPNATTDTLNVVTFTDLKVLRKQGNNAYSVYGNAAPIQAANVTVQQGTLEGSNVDLSSQMVDMISVYRKYEANQKIVSMTDKTLEFTSTLGRVGG